jgi:hypothetical protein
MLDLQTAFLDLLKKLEDTEIRLIVGGGYGIYLKNDYFRRTGKRVLYSVRPEARATNDLDLFLRPELLIHSEKLKPLSIALDALGYKVIKGAERYQFVRPGSAGGVAKNIKIDLLTGPRGLFKGTSVRTDDRRARPKPSVGVHAHVVNESPTLEEGLLDIPLEGRLSSGEMFKGEVYIPHPFTFLMMKLFAFRDRLGDANKEYGRYHALDLYAIMANTTEEEWDKTQEISGRFRADPYVLEAGRITADYFSAPTGLGVLRMMESPYYRQEFLIDEFISDMSGLFPH